MKIFIVGLGGAGKTTSGKILARKLSFDFVDLDSEFMKKVGHIGEFTNSYGYEKYVHKNLELFFELFDALDEKYAMSLSSRFLVHEKYLEVVEKHVEFIHKNGVVVKLLPDINSAKSREIVVKRQLKRGFGLKRKSEEEKFTKRFSIYQKHGHIMINSHENPEKIAQMMFEKVKYKSLLVR